MEFASWQSHLEDAERKFLKNSLGAELLASLEALPEDGNAELKICLFTRSARYDGSNRR
jgi:hypothetical protein